MGLCRGVHLCPVPEAGVCASEYVSVRAIYIYVYVHVHVNDTCIRQSITYNVNVYTHIHICIYTYIHIYIYTYIHTDMYTHVFTYAHISRLFVHSNADVHTRM